MLYYIEVITIHKRHDMKNTSPFLCEELYNVVLHCIFLILSKIDYAKIKFVGLKCKISTII